MNLANSKIKNNNEEDINTSKSYLLKSSRNFKQIFALWLVFILHR